MSEQDTTRPAALPPPATITPEILVELKEESRQMREAYEQIQRRMWRRSADEDSTPCLYAAPFAVALCALLAAGCATPWVTARGAITAADAALEALPEDIVPEAQRDDLTSARLATGAALDLGALACDVWEREATREEPTGWQKWVSDALSASAQILEIVKAAGVEVPAAVCLAIAGLQLLLPALGAL